MIFYFLELFFSLAMLALPAAALNPTQIIQRGEDHLRGKTNQALFEMKIERPAFVRTLRVKSWASGTERALVEILEPLKELGISSLRVDQQMWNYLPKTEQVVRIPTSLMLQSWMGSDFTNDDLMKMSHLTRDYHHRLVKQDKMEGHAVTLIECTPKTNRPVVWGKILYWARAVDSLPVREEYYDDRGKLVRTLSLSDFKKMDDRIFPAQFRIQKADSPQEQTTIRYEKILFDRTIADSFFERENLPNVSQQGKNPSALWFLASRGE